VAGVRDWQVQQGTAEGAVVNEGRGMRNAVP
jgi:hypothetical protein